MPRYTAGAVAALCMFVASQACATEHITIDLASGLNLGAGWGELTPERHDLRITLIAPAGLSFYNDVTAQDVTGQTLWDVESYTGSTYTFVPYGAQEDEMGWINVGGTVFDPGDPVGWMNGQMFSVRVSNALWPCASCPYENGMPVNPNDCNTGYICSLLEEGEVSIPVPGSKAVSVTVHHGLPGTLTILGAGNGLDVLNPDESPFSSAYVTGSGMHSVQLLLHADESFTGSVTLTCRFLQDGADLDSQDVVEAKPVVVDLDIAGVEEEDEQEVGGFVAVRTSDNPAPRKQIMLKVEGLEEGTATLTRSNARVRVFTTSEDGEEITFNGQDNTWPVNAVPRSLYVQGAAASLGFRDVVLTLSADGAGSDNVNFTVLLATFSQVRTGFRKGGAGGDPTDWDGGRARRRPRTTTRLSRSLTAGWPRDGPIHTGRCT